MKTATITELKKEMKERSKEELIELCLTLGKYKKESKELLTYLLFEADDEDAYIQGVKDEIDEHLSEVNTSSFYFVKKSIRKTLRLTKKYIRFSKKKDTETELLLYFCKVLKSFKPSITRSTTMKNLYYKQLELAEKANSKLHEDLQFDNQQEIEELSSL